MSRLLADTREVLDHAMIVFADDAHALGALTAQERILLDLLGEGLTNRQIAARMFLAEKTVKNYVSRLLAKLGMERRTQAAVFASKHGRPDRTEE